ncbi:MAG: VCBS repeat-containing protein [bacterium]|nr:VCBS repeat-containing protein [bacterium]
MKNFILRFYILSIFMILVIAMFFRFSLAGVDAVKDAPGFLNSNFSNYVNTIPTNYLSNYSNFLGVNDIIGANINLPSGATNNIIYPYNVFNNSLLRDAYAILNSNRVPNAWFVRSNGTWYSLQFSQVVTDFNFSAPSLINPGGNYNAMILWDPTLTPSFGIGITFNRKINKIVKQGSNINVIQIADYTNSGINHSFNAATIGDFNNDNIPDIFVIGSNESDNTYSKIKGAYSISGRIDNIGNLSFNQINTITPGSSTGTTWDRVYVQWTSDAVKSRALIVQDGNVRRVPIDFNNDNREDIIIAGADGNIWYVPNTTTPGSNTITFGNPIKIMTSNQTGLSTGFNNGKNGNLVIDLGDIDNDGTIDLVVANTDSPDIKIFKGNPNFNPNSTPNTNNNSPFLSNGQNVISLYTKNNQNNPSRNTNVVESMDYKGPNTQVNSSNPNNPPNPEYVGAANNITLVDFNRDRRLDISITTDNWNYSPSNMSNYSIMFKDRNNVVLSKPGGRIYTFINSSVNQGSNTNVKFKGYFLGQYALTNNNLDADFDGLSIMNLSNPSAFDIVATDGNHSQTLFTFEQLGNNYINADRFILESKDFISLVGSDQDAYNYNRGRFYIKQATLTINGNSNGYDLKIYMANSFNGGNPVWVSTNQLTNPMPGSLIVEFNFWPSNSNFVQYRINNGVWQNTGTPKMKGASLAYKIEIIVPASMRTTTTNDLTGNSITALTNTININGINLSYISTPRSIRITNWKEVR